MGGIPNAGHSANPVGEWTLRPAKARQEACERKARQRNSAANKTGAGILSDGEGTRCLVSRHRPFAKCGARICSSPAARFLPSSLASYWRGREARTRKNFSRARYQSLKNTFKDRHANQRANCKSGDPTKSKQPPCLHDLLASPANGQHGQRPDFQEHNQALFRNTLASRGERKGGERVMIWDTSWIFGCSMFVLKLIG